MLKLWDFKCDKCGHEFEELSDDETANCPKCDNKVEREKLCLGKFGAFSIKDADGKRQELLRRSAAHTLSELKKEPEKFGKMGIERARDGQIRSFGGIKKD